MKKYKVEFIQTDIFIIDVSAKNEEEAKQKAGEAWNKIAGDGISHYYQVEDTNVSVGTVYDVTNTDDPFSPIII